MHHLTLTEKPKATTMPWLVVTAIQGTEWTVVCSGTRNAHNGNCCICAMQVIVAVCYQTMKFYAVF